MDAGQPELAHLPLSPLHQLAGSAGFTTPPPVCTNHLQCCIQTAIQRAAVYPWACLHLGACRAKLRSAHADAADDAATKQRFTRCCQQSPCYLSPYKVLYTALTCFLGCCTQSRDTARRYLLLQARETRCMRQSPPLPAWFGLSTEGAATAVVDWWSCRASRASLVLSSMWA